MRYLFLLVFIFCGWVNAQVAPNSKVIKDPFFNKPGAHEQEASQKVKNIHSDTTGIDPEEYDSNLVFSGNVVFEHQGSVLSADKVIWFQKENFLKAIGNVVLTTTEGTKITAKEMEYDGNTQRGIARKDVVLTDPKQTIKTEILYYDRIPNTAYFNTGGTITNADTSMYTNSATYYINSKDINFVGKSTIETKDYTIVSDNIKTNEATKLSQFFGPTTIRSKKDYGNYIYTEQGDSSDLTGISNLNKNSRIHFNGKVLTGKKLVHDRNTGFGKAIGDVMLDDPKEKRYIKGGYAEAYEKKDSAMVTEKPYLVKVLTKDSLYIAAEKFISYQRPDSTKVKKSYVRAYHQVRAFKTNLQARADSLSANETDGQMHFIGKPIAWSGAKQISGDEIKAYMDIKTEKMDSVKVLGNAFAISKADSLNMKDEFNQVKGKWMAIYFKDGEIDIAKTVGNAQSILYADNTDEKTKETTRIGVAIAVSGEIEAQFIEKKIEVITYNIGVQSDVYPMSLIAREKRFFPDFNWNTKDRLQKWSDIFLDSPNYEETQYESDNFLYNKAEEERLKLEEKNKPKTPVRVKR